jgi:hypothetical protein
MAILVFFFKPEESNIGHKFLKGGFFDIPDYAMKFSKVMTYTLATINWKSFLIETAPIYDLITGFSVRTKD